MEYRKAKRLTVKVGDNELKIEGPVSDRTLEKRINRFKELIEGATYEDIDVVLPRGVNRKITRKKATRGWTQAFGVRRPDAAYLAFVSWIGFRRIVNGKG
jgi:hypothetical protein